MASKPEKNLRLSEDELRALSSKLKGWVVDGPEKAALDSAEAKIDAALTAPVYPDPLGTGHP